MLDCESHVDSQQKYVEGMIGLAGEERYKIQKLLEDVKQKFEKPVQTFEGMRATCVEANVEAFCISAGDGDDEKGEPPIILLSLPYFELAPLFRKAPTQDFRVHQLRTLLKHPSAHAPNNNSLSKGQCHHVSYLWCLFIGNGRPQF